MIQKMIDGFAKNYNYNEEFYGEGNGILAPRIIKHIFEKYDLWKLMNIRYSEIKSYKQLKTMISTGKYNYFEDGFSQEKFYTEKSHGLLNCEEIPKILTWEILNNFERFIIHRIIESQSVGHLRYEKIHVLSEFLYNKIGKDNDETIIASKLLLNQDDLKLIYKKSSVGGFMHLRDNLYVNRSESDSFQNFLITFKNSLCDYVPSEDVLMFKLCKDTTQCQIFFDATIENMNKNINFYICDGE